MSIWQTKSWQKMLKKSGQVSDFFDVNWIFVEKRQVAFWESWLFILWLEKDLSEKNVNELINLCKKENCLFIQIENINYEWNIEIAINNLKKWYYKKFITPYSAVIDLRSSEDEILANMKSKGRYNIKLARKKWVEIKEVEKNNENIDSYYKLMLETTSRDNFNWNNLDYYRTFLDSIDNSRLLLAYVEWNVVAGWIFTFDSDISIYYYWASTWDKKYRNLMGPYLLQWEAIKIAKLKWSKFYDFLWVASPNEKNSSLAWVTDFKKKLSQDIRKVSNSYIWINKIFKYNLIVYIKYFKKILFKK